MLLQVARIGKACHSDCEIKRLMGECVMPKQAVFAQVLKGGEVRDDIEVLDLRRAGADPLCSVRRMHTPISQE